MAAKSAKASKKVPVKVVKKIVVPARRKLKAVADKVVKPSPKPESKPAVKKPALKAPKVRKQGAKPGRGRFMELDTKMKRINVSLDDATIAKATRFGAGNLSRGLRAAVRLIQK